MRVLVTGIAGFAGSHLAEYLVQATDATVHGVIHRHDRRIQHLRSRLTLHRGDLRNALWVDDLIQTVMPDVVFHLAAWSDVGGSWQQPWTTYELNIQCQLYLLDALRRHCPTCRTVVVTSNEVYGLVRADELPVDEETPLRPHSPYGVSKIAQDMMALQYWNSHRLPTIRMRSFNHVGPDQADDFVTSAFARQIAEIEAGLRPPLVMVGNLDTMRDFTDVRDIACGYWLAAQQGEPGQVYNVGSGQAHSIRWVLETLLAMSPAAIRVEIDTARLRPSDVPVSVCDSGRLRRATGWEPAIPLQESLRATLDFWRRHVQRNMSDDESVPAGAPAKERPQQ